MILRNLLFVLLLATPVFAWAEGSSLAESADSPPAELNEPGLMLFGGNPPASTPNPESLSSESLATESTSIPPAASNKTSLSSHVVESTPSLSRPALSELDKQLPLHSDAQITRLLVEAAFLEKEGSTKYSNENVNKRLKLYEQIALRACVPDFASSFTIPHPLPADLTCNETLEKIQSFHATNPTVACLRQGQDSQECALFSAQQRTLATQINERNSALYRLTVGTADESAVQNFKQLQTQVGTVLQAPGSDLTVEQAAILNKYLAVTCREYGLATEVLPDAAPKERDPAKLALLKEIESLQKNPSIKPSPEAAALRLVRLLPQPCFATIESIKKKNIFLASAICFEFGPLAPQCLNALRQEIRQRRNSSNRNSSRPPGSSQTDGLQGF